MVHDQHAVHGLRGLGQQVAGHQHGPAVCGKVPAAALAAGSPAPGRGGRRWPRSGADALAHADQTAPVTWRHGTKAPRATRRGNANRDIPAPLPCMVGDQADYVRPPPAPRIW